MIRFKKTNYLHKIFELRESRNLETCPSPYKCLLWWTQNIFWIPPEAFTASYLFIHTCYCTHLRRHNNTTTRTISDRRAHNIFASQSTTRESWRYFVPKYYVSSRLKSLAGQLRRNVQTWLYSTQCPRRKIEWIAYNLVTIFHFSLS